MSMTLEVEFLAGTSIEQSIMEARELAKKLGLAYTKYDFNGVKMSVGKNAVTEEGAEAYNTAASGDDSNKFVVVN